MHANVLSLICYRGQSNISEMATESIHDLYVTYGQLKMHCACVLYISRLRDHHMGEQIRHDPNITLYTAAAREIRIDQSGFSRWENIHCPHVNCKLTGKALKSSNFSHWRLH